jgi:hypothetical protein
MSMQELGLKRTSVGTIGREKTKLKISRNSVGPLRIVEKMLRAKA